MANLVTKTGDLGMTSWFNGVRQSKIGSGFEFIGNIDELGSLFDLFIFKVNEKHGPVLVNALGLKWCREELEGIYKGLASLEKDVFPPIGIDVDRLDVIIDGLVKKYLNGEAFPGLCHIDHNSEIAHLANVCRAVTRRLERNSFRFWVERGFVDEKGNLLEENYTAKTCMQFLNRLSDYFYTVARVLDTQV